MLVSLQASTRKFQVLLAVGLVVILSGCGGGSDNNPPTNNSASSSSSSTSSSSSSSSNSSSGGENNVVISGTITFDLVPHNPLTNGLNYDASSETAARGIVIEAVDASENVLDETQTDSSGSYNLSVPPNTDLRVRAYAQLKNDSPAWDIQVTDNTDGNALYAIQGSLASSGSENSTRNLHAPSGWGISNYTGTRSAAPFAILHAVYKSLDKIAPADPDLVLPPTEIRWSVNNRATPGNVSAGDIGNSFYSSEDNAIYLLGSENNDSDEYDHHVVTHEFAHYLDENIFRSDSIGGLHLLNEYLDTRVAFSEGYANAFAAISLDAPVYRDSMRTSQSEGFSFDVSDGETSNPGWFNETSIQAFVYALYQNDANNFTAIINTLTSEDFVNTPALTGVHVFGSLLKQQNSSLSSLVDSLASTHEFTLVDIWASGESNSGGLSNTLPLYHPIAVNGASVEVCSNNTHGEYNKLGNMAYLIVDLPSLDTYTITATRSSGLANSNPDFLFIQRGLLYGRADSTIVNTETLTRSYNPGTGIIELWEESNRDDQSGGGDVCFDVTISN